MKKSALKICSGQGHLRGKRLLSINLATVDAAFTNIPTTNQVLWQFVVIQHRMAVNTTCA